MRTIALLTISNIFMTFAWYGHLKYRDVPLYKVVVVSWLIAFFEYCFQVPANRVGSYEFTAAQLKTIQEVITLTVFAVELHRRLRLDRRGRRSDLQKMVNGVCFRKPEDARRSNGWLRLLSWLTSRIRAPLQHGHPALLSRRYAQFSHPGQ